MLSVTRIWIWIESRIRRPWSKRGCRILAKHFSLFNSLKCWKTSRMPLISDDVYNEIFNDSASEQVFYEVTPRKSFETETQKWKYCNQSFFSFQSYSSKTGKYGIDGMQVFSAMSPARHFRYHAVTGSILIVAGIALIVKRPFGKDLKISHLINFRMILNIINKF